MGQLHQFEFSGKILQRGFWLYCWTVGLADGKTVYYVGRTGDSSSLKAQSPFARISGHLGPNDHANALQQHLKKKGLVATDCERFNFVAYGPLFGEGKDMQEHRERRNQTHALEKALCEAMTSAGYAVLNTVPCHHPLNEEVWSKVRGEFHKFFDKL